ncbi:hypothetical protein ACN20G_10300 [Streptomyces sp. BI20]|uniref:hypothetical protein n=1 Tax=Streptomyces sp. BI20 TaxID=3403460 RepID=UPI003C72B2A0
MTTPRVVLAATLTALALAVSMFSGWGREFPDGKDTPNGTGRAEHSEDRSGPAPEANEAGPRSPSPSRALAGVGGGTGVRL